MVDEWKVLSYLNLIFPQAELIPLPGACQLAKDLIPNIHNDNPYVFGVAHVLEHWGRSEAS